jgi:hypothetical protein
LRSFDKNLTNYETEPGDDPLLLNRYNVANRARHIFDAADLIIRRSVWETSRFLREEGEGDAGCGLRGDARGAPHQFWNQ